MSKNDSTSASAERTEAARRYDQSINWQARLGREIPRLTAVFGPPGPGGILDAGCGTGRQAVALSEKGYQVTALDADQGMLEVAKENAQRAEQNVTFLQAPYASISEATAGNFDGLYCLGNALAAAGDSQGCRDAMHGFASALRPGGRLFVQILNFRIMRAERPCVRGPRVTVHDGIEYVSMRHFTFDDQSCDVTNITLWNDGGWRHRAHTGTLFAIDVHDMIQWCEQAGLNIDDTLAGYAGEPFDVGRSTDLIVVATRQPA